MITTLEDAQHEFAVSQQEYAADMGCEVDDFEAADFIVATAMNCDKDTAYELCGTEIGWVPDEVATYFRNVP